MKQKFKSLFRALLGLLGIIKHEQFTHSDIHGNLYYFDGDTSEYTISSIQACASGRITAVSEMFSNTDNLEIRIAPAKSKRNTADSWRIARCCPDTGSEVSILSSNVAKQAEILLEKEETSKVWAANEQSMVISGTTKVLVKIENTTRVCKFWLTPSVRDRIVLSRQELMNFHIIPRSFPSIMRHPSADTKMCQSCASIMSLNHFENLGKNHFVSVINKKNPDRPVTSKDIYLKLLKKACAPCQKNLIKHHYETLPKTNRNLIVSAITMDNALRSNNKIDTEEDMFERLKAKLIFK